MDCEAIQEKLSCYVDGELSPRDYKAVQRHLECCVGCSEQLALTQRLVTETAAFVEVESPRYLRKRIALSTIAAPPALWRYTLDTLRDMFTRATVGWSAATGALAAAVIIVAAFVSTREPVTLLPAENPPAVAGAKGEIPKTHRITPTIDVSVQPSTPAVAAATSKPRKPGVGNSVSSPARTVQRRRQPSGFKTTVTARAITARQKKPAVVTQSSAPDRDGLAENSAVEEPKNDAVADAGSWNTREEGFSGSTAKSSMVDVLAVELSSTAEDDEAMIRSLKQQLRMQRRGDGVFVDVIDVRF